MFGIDFQNTSPWINVAIFAALVAVVWFAGTRLAYYSDEISERTGLGKAFAGLILLALATSLPEIATTLTAASYGNASLAAGNLLGGVVMQTSLIAVADIAAGGRALTYFTPRPTLLLEGAILVLILSLAVAGSIVGDTLVFGVGIWTTGIFTVYLVAIYMIKNYEAHETWQPIDIPEIEKSENKAKSERKERFENFSGKKLGLFYAAAGIVILSAGYFLTRVVEALSEQTGMAASFVGATLLAVSTSLPELSTTVTAVRLGACSMAVSNIFGSNAIDVSLLFVTDAVYQGEPVLTAVGRPGAFMATVGIIVTVVYLIGLIERRDQAFLRAGLDSHLVLAIYFASLIGLYFLQ